MKKIFAGIVSAFLSVVFLAGCAGSGGGGGGTKRISFLYTGAGAGDGNIGEQIKRLVETYNDTQGKEDGISVRVATVTDDGYDSRMQVETQASKGAFDVFGTRDEYFKKYAQYFETLDEYEGLEDITADIYENQLSRLRYDVVNNTSNADDALYALPLVNSISVMYYNRTLLEQTGVKVISVAEEDLAAFNAGGADANGKTKADLSIPSDFTVPARGFYRENAYVKQSGTDEGNWTRPANGELMIFNEKIAMSWDEMEDIGMLMTRSVNNSSPTDYGYWTEWWFAYGWSVGGDCIEDISGNGDWKYTLPDSTPNYIVTEGRTYTGAYTGTVYKAGETLDFLDKLNVGRGDVVVANNDNTFTVNGQSATVRPAVEEAVRAGALVELPSTREAFSRFALLAGEGGLGICPTVSTVSTNAINWFNSGRLAFCVEEFRYSADVGKAMTQRGNDWGVAPLPIYKTYDADGNVETQGKLVAHSLGYGIAINKNSQMKEEAWKFVSWMADEGQTVLAQNGYFSSHSSDEGVYLENTSYPNAAVLGEINSYSQPGDWWYMPDRSWVDIWATPLNSQVRNGTMSLESFFANYTGATNSALAAYKKSSNEGGRL